MENDVWSIFFSGAKTLRFQKGAGESAGSAGFVRILIFLADFGDWADLELLACYFLTTKGTKVFRFKDFKK